MAFDITSVLKGAAGTAGEEQIVYLPLDDLDPDPNNFYSLDGINDLAGNIELVGLQQPLRVRPGEEPGRYTVVSGHRRRAALQLIRDGYDSESAGRARWEKAACIVDYGKASAAMKELQLIYANASTRQPSAPELSRQAERVTELLYQLKEEGHSFPGRMRDHVAAACQVSKTKLARLHAIRANLVPDLLEEFDDGRLNESVAYRISQEKAAVQRELAKRTGPSIRDYDINRTEAAIAQVKEPKPAAPEPKFDGHGHLEFDGRTYLAERAREDEEYYEMLKEEAVALLRRVPGFRSRQEGIEQLKNHHGKSNHGWSTDFGFASASPKGLTMEKWRPGQKDVKIMRTWTEVYDMLSVYVINRAEQFLAPKVSEPDTGAGIQWHTGTPTVGGEYMTRLGIGVTETPQAAYWQRLEWHEETGWVYPKNWSPLPEGSKVFRWFKLPEV